MLSCYMEQERLTEETPKDIRQKTILPELRNLINQLHTERGVSKLCEKTGLSRTTLHNLKDQSREPNLYTVETVLSGMGRHLEIVADEGEMANE